LRLLEGLYALAGEKSGIDGPTVELRQTKVAIKTDALLKSVAQGGIDRTRHSGLLHDDLPPRG
jgi:hypothetical protein